MKKTPLRRKTPLRAKGFTVTAANIDGVMKGVKRALKRSKLHQVQRKVKKRPKQPTITKLKKQLWEECKRITRERHGFRCYTCGAVCEHPHTGHFISSSVCSTFMRYHLDNLRPQCYRCNIHLSGNWIAFERHLLRDGIDVENLKIENELSKGLQYDRLWFEAQLSEYKSL